MEAFITVLSEDERHRLAAIGHPLVREAWGVCRATLRELLGRYTGIPPGRILLRPGPNGKPVLDPGQKQQIEFNVSHSEGMGLIAVAMGRCVGVDVEAHRERMDIEGLVARVLSEAERAAIRELPQEARAAAFYRAWTRREAALKARGGTLAELAARGPATAREPATPRGPATQAGDGWRLQDLAVGQGYAAAVCWNGGPASVALWSLE